jgi:hypothetical protein
MRTATRHVETDPLGAIRAELVGAGWRRVALRRRRRRTAAAGAALVALLAVAAGASALGEFSTGVPAVDDLLAVETPSSPVDEPAGDATEPLPVPTNDGTAQVVAYLSRDGTICAVEAQRHPRIEGSVRGGGGGCWRAADLARRLERNGVVWSSWTEGPARRTYKGYAHGDVESIRVLGEAAGAEVRMTEPWTPRTEGAGALRLIVVIDERDLDLYSLPLPVVEVTYADGRTEKVVAP